LASASELDTLDTLVNAVGRLAALPCGEAQRTGCFQIKLCVLFPCPSVAFCGEEKQAQRLGRSLALPKVTTIILYGRSAAKNLKRHIFSAQCKSNHDAIFPCSSVAFRGEKKAVPHPKDRT
jgi:hypothetical protein